MPKQRLIKVELDQNQIACLYEAVKFFADNNVDTDASVISTIVTAEMSINEIYREAQRQFPARFPKSRKF